MPRYVVEEETVDGKQGATHGPFDGLAVAKAVARKIAEETRRAAVVRDHDSRETLGRFEAAAKVESPDEPPSLAHSVRRMRAANDELKKALIPLSERAKKG